MEDTSENYNYKTLHSMIGESVCVIDDQGNKATLSISEVSKNTLDGDQWEAFSVLYTGDTSFRIAQGVYIFQHAKFGEKSLFLSPNSETKYETVITRKRKIIEKEPAF
ncbi:MAG: hypothetical protein ACI9Y1_001486 [Lentisphaeria bacterium]|jgi:hypothetical protein